MGGRHEWVNPHRIDEWVGPEMSGWESGWVEPEKGGGDRPKCKHEKGHKQRKRTGARRTRGEEKRRERKQGPEGVRESERASETE